MNNSTKITNETRQNCLGHLDAYIAKYDTFFQIYYTARGKKGNEALLQKRTAFRLHIDEIRHLLRMDTSELASALGVKCVDIYNWRAGRANVPKKIISAFRLLIESTSGDSSGCIHSKQKYTHVSALSELILDEKYRTLLEAVVTVRKAGREVNKDMLLNCVWIITNASEPVPATVLEGCLNISIISASTEV